MDKVILSVPEAHSGLINENITFQSVAIFGVGHLGSNMALALSKMGVPEFNLYDFDTVEDRNIAGGPFNRSHVGMKKIQAMKEIIETSNMEVKLIDIFDKKVGPRTKLTRNNVYVIATDSLESRIAIFKAVSKLKGHVIDLRSRAHLGIIYSFSLDDEIAKLWYADSMNAQLKDDTPPVSCNEANIIYNSYMIASLGSRIFSQLLDGNSELRAYKIDSDQLKILELPMNYTELSKKYSKKIKGKPCDLCNKSHKTETARLNCAEKNKIKAVQKKNAKFTSRDQFL